MERIKVATVEIKDLESLGWEFQPDYEEVSEIQGISLEEAKKYQRENYAVVIRVHDDRSTTWEYRPYNNGNHPLDTQATGDDEKTLEDLSELYQAGKLWDVEFEMTKNEILNIARSSGACDEGIQAFEAWKGTYDEFCLTHPDYGLWMEGLGDFMQLETLRECALARPKIALEYLSEKLDRETLRDLSMANMELAIKYAKYEIDESTLKEIALLLPEEALKYARSLLDSETIRKVALRRPYVALQYEYILDEETLKECKRLVSR